MSLNYYVSLIKADYESRFSGGLTTAKFIKSYLFDINFRVVVRYRIQSYFFYKKGLGKILAVLIRNGNIKKYGIEIGLNSRIDGGLHVHHVNGIVIGNNVRVGTNFNIFQQVTIGKKGEGYPIIGNDVWIYPGSKVIGNIVIEDNVIVGANSIVYKNVKAKKVVAGIPAKEILGNRQEKKEVR
ncbi:serine O-acetyltransferase [Priestia aryabhattai]|uniref:serine O-acetyltransferase n=1 Tax=Priestia aryabhattai TaxID=412384 RepID=UPI001C0A9554|nr:hypothetical protein [Priestia aryabhattai]MBU3570701.1 serine O-acetyltransferase [Priestia aryabhattai]